MTIKDVPWTLTDQPAAKPVTVGESHTRASLPDEVLLRMMRRMDAEQNRHLHIASMNENLITMAEAFTEVAVQLGKLTTLFDQRLPKAPAAEEETPEPELKHNGAGLPIPEWVKAESDAERPAP